MFTFDNDGIPIAVIGKEILSTNDKGKINGSSTKKIIIPLPPEKRFICYISGPSGSGKSTFAANYTNMYKKLNPKNEIYIFSRGDIEDDPAFNKIKKIKQLNYSSEYLEDFETTYFDNCLFIFDDIATIIDEKQKNQIFKIITDILEVGRKNNISCIFTSHLINMNERKLTRTILNESHFIVLFPGSGHVHGIEYVLKTYYGKTKKQIESLLQIKTRWLYIHTHSPQYYLAEYQFGRF